VRFIFPCGYNDTPQRLVPASIVEENDSSQKATGKHGFKQSDNLNLSLPPSHSIIKGRQRTGSKHLSSSCGNWLLRTEQFHGTVEGDQRNDARQPPERRSRTRCRPN
jgi:hypothetical protein